MKETHIENLQGTLPATLIETLIEALTEILSWRLFGGVHPPVQMVIIRSGNLIIRLNMQLPLVNLTTPAPTPF